MKVFILLVLTALASGDHGAGGGHSHGGAAHSHGGAAHGASHGAAHGATHGATHGAAHGSARHGASGHAASSHSSGSSHQSSHTTVTQTRGSYSAPAASYATPTSGYSAPQSGYAAPVRQQVAVQPAQYTAPQQAYEAPATYSAPRAASASRTETISSPAQAVEYQIQWQAPVYQRLVQKSGYAAPSSGYEAASQSGYAAASGGESAQREIVPGQEANAYVSFQQQIEGSQGTRSYAANGEVEEQYSESKPSYRYSYGVEDSYNGDVKKVEETRDGDQFSGSYSFMQPDGCQRTVTYRSDEWNAFAAVVEYKGPGCAEKYDIPSA